MSRKDQLDTTEEYERFKADNIGHEVSAICPQGHGADTLNLPVEKREARRPYIPNYLRNCSHYRWKK